VSKPESAVVTKIRGVSKPLLAHEYGVPNPEIYGRVWDAVDIVEPSVGEEFGGFFILTGFSITPNQTRSICPEDEEIDGSVCESDSECPKGHSLRTGNGFMTGKCVLGNHSLIKTCEVEAWCPIQTKKK